MPPGFARLGEEENRSARGRRFSAGLRRRRARGEVAAGARGRWAREGSGEEGRRRGGWLWRSDLAAEQPGAREMERDRGEERWGLGRTNERGE